MSLFFHANKRQRDDLPLLFKEAARRCQSRRIKKDAGAWVVDEAANILRASLYALISLSNAPIEERVDYQMLALLKNHRQDAEQYAERLLQGEPNANKRLRA